MIVSSPSFLFFSFGRRSRGAPLFVVGFFMVVLSLAFVWYTEEPHTRMVEAFDELQQKTIDLNAEGLDSTGSDQAVRFTGEVTTDSTLSDEIFGVEARALKLERRVDVYQWIGSDSQGAQQGWHSELLSIDDADDGTLRRNPTTYFAEPKTMTASTARIGDLGLHRRLFDGVPTEESVPITSSAREEMDDWLRRELASIGEDTIYYGNASPPFEIGDHRITFRAATPGTYTVLGELSVGEIRQFSDIAGAAHFSVIRPGEWSKAEILEEVRPRRSENSPKYQLYALLVLFVGLWLFAFDLKLGKSIPGITGISFVSQLVIALLTAAGFASVLYGALWFGRYPVIAGSSAGIGVVLSIAGIWLSLRTRQGAAQSSDESERFDWETQNE